MTEEEAKTKWCPFARTQYVGEPDKNGDRYRESYPANRMYAPDLGCGTDAALCIASACMAWRQTDNYVGPCAAGEDAPTPKPAGYCGLAGRPE